jgi:tetratricopeptide (TPR) repeat protein
MADIVKLKKKAADFEAKKQMDKALNVCREIIDAYESGDEDPVDIPFYNRVGDLMQRAGNLSDAVSIWEKAVDHYTEGGFYNPAIALCNKILRASPGRTVIYYKLGKISAEKGFKADARQNFLEYASRQQKAGNMDEAFRTLKEFADLVPDQYDVRLMLADQLLKAGKKTESVAQLQVGYAQAMADGHGSDADAFAAKMKEIDPTIEPKANGAASASGSAGLVFLDVDTPTGRKSVRAPSTADTKRLSKAVEGLSLIDPGLPEPVKAAPKPPETAPPLAPEPPAMVIESSSVGEDTPPPPRGSLMGLEATSFSDEVAPTEGASADTPGAEESGADDATATDAATLEMIDVDTSPIEEPPTVPTAVPELSMLDVEESAPAPDVEPIIEPEPTLSSDLPMVEEDSSMSGGLVMLDSDSEMGSNPMDAPEPISEIPTASTELVTSLDGLRANVESAPEDWSVRRQFAEALLESGERAEGVTELEKAMAGYERDGDLDTASSIAEEIVRLEPKSIRFHQKRVEFAFRANDRALLAEAYIELADALLADGQAQKARVVYQRVLDITPDDLRAQAAIESIPEEAEEEAAPAPRRSTTAAPVRATPAPKAAKPKGDADDDFVSLGDWLREDDEPKSTRMVVEEKEPTGDEQADFADMLRKFKQGVSDNVDAEDHEAHYDLGVAYKEMGLLDEAIAEFQKALRGTTGRVRAFEALGHCFIEKRQLPVGSTILQRALAEPNVRDEELVGVLYLLGAINEEMQAYPEAKKYYERVFSVDIQFRDVGDRLNAVEKNLA